MEKYKIISISDLFQKGELVPEYKDLVEWQISVHSSRGKDNKGIPIVYNKEKDALEIVPSFADRVAEWNKEVHPDDFPKLNVLPNERIYRQYLNHEAVFHTQLGEFIQ